MEKHNSTPLFEKKIEIRKKDSEAIGQNLDLSKIVAGIKSKSWIIGLTSLLCTVAGLVAFMLGPKTYQAESLLFYELKVPPTLSNHYAVNHLSYTTAVELAQLPINYRSVRTILGLDMDETELAKMVSIQTPQKGSSLIRINATGTSPELVLNIANTLAKVTAKRALEFNQTQLKDAYSYFVRELDVQRKALDQSTLELAQFRIDNKQTGSDSESLPLLEKIGQLEAKLNDVSLEYNGIVVQYELSLIHI